ncbi:MAG: hypothetical protein COX79_02950 [Candidatus Levybacteria bacterium CG_4_10_14_0_2_um_filter_36_16]|nr:MAG: hypothetical protein AUK12_01170 [Candidatus Levybacteria bacterium CG2_30_37_29]PIR79593.1 MAG: hypothetical protein COU26_00370 [Candidatus Levybacteria bacterium CG10_big_fil_rev_8_21_14_0_10_36_30]PIZ97283.1 MAG: hypothetical protein COX79_02950 [Candidatus Levybacteria bacterium CG_4_10_14_0_2_um_filter_36_16]PJA90937.1 MAG: hypothetical protein CO136_00020 [Candidatus Levybacteria bacterium CG_4_9_14_3_um_filter_36_7]
MERKGYYSHGLVSQEKLRIDRIKGVAGIVVSRDGRLLVGTEQMNKPSTRRKKGEISIPFETLKPKELGAEGGFVSALLTEISTDASIKRLQGKLESAGVIDQIEVMSDIWVATVLLRYNSISNTMPFEAPHPEEFSDLRWMGAKTLLSMQNVREFTFPVLNNVIEINRRRPSKVNFRPLYLEPYVPSVYEKFRELEQDIELDGLQML